MATTLTFNATTEIWSRTSLGIISWPSTVSAVASGPFVVEALTVPFDPIHQTGGSFWELKEGPNVGWLVSAWTNSLGYGNITVSIGAGEYTPPAYVPDVSFPTINPLADWRILIKAMGGASGDKGHHMLTVNSSTKIWSRTNAGIINYTYDLGLPALAAAGGPYWVNPIIVPFDPIHQTGGSFWELKEGPNVGWLVSDWTNTLGYGNITVGVSGTFNRGPGATLATIYRPEAHLAGFSINYNAGGELHFTLLVDDPNINIPIPKQTHAAVEFYDIPSATWVEVWAGWIWDMDATDTEVVFYGIDYLGALQYTVDERFDPAKPKRAAPTGSYYCSGTGNPNYIHDIVRAQLKYSIDKSDSIVGFCAIGNIATMNESIHGIYSTMTQTLPFVVGLLDSHKAGTGKLTRLSVRKIAGVYTFVVEGDPGVARNPLALRYGQLVQGYRAIPFGASWASHVNIIGRTVQGIKAYYRSDTSAVDQAVWGSIGQGAVIIDCEDENDLKRRAHQAAVDASRLGKQVSVGLKLGSFRPLEGYDLTDYVPMDIDHGAVHTKNWGSDPFAQDPSGDPSAVQADYYAIVGLQWESYDDGHWMTSLGLYPKAGGVMVTYAAEPSFQTEARGAVEWQFYEMLGVDLQPDATLLQGDPFGGAFGPLPVDSTRAGIVFCAASQDGYPKTTSMTAGWTVDDDHTDGSGGGKGLFAAHKIFVPFGAATISASAGITQLAGGMMAAFYGTPSDTIVIRQSWRQNGGDLPGSGIVVTPPLEPLVGGVIIGFGSQGAYFNVGGEMPVPYVAGSSPLISYIAMDGGGVDAGLGGYTGEHFFLRGAYHVPWFLELNSPVPIAVPPDTQVSPGPPGASTPPSNTYTDSVTGKQYVYNSLTNSWDYVAGTGHTASGLYDFTFAAATTWVITHTLDGYPRVTITLAGGEVVQAQINYDSTSQITVSFFVAGVPYAVAGTAHLGW